MTGAPHWRFLMAFDHTKTIKGNFRINEMRRYTQRNSLYLVLLTHEVCAKMYYAF